MTLQESILNKIPEDLKNNLFLAAFGLTKIPLIFFLSPRVMEVNDQRCVLKIPLTRRSRNHLKSMYFGALCVGADCAGGMIAMKLIKEQKTKIDFIFKDFKAEFHKRAEGDVLFTCTQGEQIQALVKKTAESGHRENLEVQILATVPSKLGHEPVAKFTLTLSLKAR